VLGGSTPADSPFLRRPDLLRSLITYWHNHPSLSYLFSGLFLGPTSQAPRIDEGRHDSLYEIEIAFSRFAPPDSQTPPWFVDRALRHLLVDVTGNTHRAEFCIDKLYSPDLSSGRRGLLEMRAFEMPPDARMSVAQQLLLRALIARFWREPYTAGLTRWGTELHDRFMLPYFIALDFDDVIEELRRAGYDLSSDWFAPHLEFRFPLAGELSAAAIHLTLRQALEPWHVLGEEGAAGGTARFVDSSLERMQLLVSGLTGDRFVITCNGRPAAAAADGAQRRVRRRRSLPRVAAAVGASSDDTGAHAADVRHRRHLDGASVAGCQYHVMHPGGRNYDLFPCEQLRGREPAPRAIYASGPHAGTRPRRPSGAKHGVSLHVGFCEPSCDEAFAFARLRRALTGTSTRCGRMAHCAAMGGIRGRDRAARGVSVRGAEAHSPSNRRERRHLQRVRDRGRMAAPVEPRRPPADRAGGGVGAARARPAAARTTSELRSPPICTARRCCCVKG
jgi:uncharacterized protein (DUF2126 family)